LNEFLFFLKFTPLSLFSYENFFNPSSRVLFCGNEFDIIAAQLMMGSNAIIKEGGLNG